MLIMDFILSRKVVGGCCDLEYEVKIFIREIEEIKYELSFERCINF